MSTGSELAKGAALAAADVIGALIKNSMLSAEQRAAAEKVAEEALLNRPDPKLLGDAYAAAKAKGPAK